MNRNKLSEIKCEEFLKKGFKVNADGTITSNKGVCVGSKMKTGYISISAVIDGKKQNLLAHHLVFYYSYGFVPEQINHIDHNTNNNRIENLEASYNHHNCLNKRQKGKCFSWHKRKGLYCVYRMFMNKLYHIYQTEDYKKAKNLGEEVRNLNTLEEIMDFKSKLYKST